MKQGLRVPVFLLFQSFSLPLFLALTFVRVRFQLFLARFLLTSFSHPTKYAALACDTLKFFFFFLFLASPLCRTSHPPGWYLSLSLCRRWRYSLQINMAAALIVSIDFSTPPFAEFFSPLILLRFSFRSFVKLDFFSLIFAFAPVDIFLFILRVSFHFFLFCALKGKVRNNKD